MLPLILLLMLLLPGLLCMRRSLPDRALRLYRLMAWGLGGIVMGSMAAQETILFLAGQLTWATGLPLHLCSLMGLTVLPALVTRRETLLSALLYAGVPGAALALIFPAVADTPWPGLTRFFFLLMHAGIVVAPLLPMAAGWRPRPMGALRAGLFLLGAGIAASFANAMTGGNYLFLAGPVAGTPLVILARWGRGAYRLLLAILATLVLTGEAAIILLVTHCGRRQMPEG